MSSWFSVDSLKDFANNVNVDSIKEYASHVDVGESWKGFSNSVQKALPKVDEGFIEKLTLTSPELAAERLKIDQEEREKETLRNSLAGLLPWETRDPERDILVEECREAILKLSDTKTTFSGPYGSEMITAQDDEKLKKLEPLPVRLRDFNLDAHVGLIERLLKEDPALVQQQSTLSAGGERERTFWRNYFFHCAFTRYECGLSIDEIWSDDPPVFATPSNPELEEAVEEGEETITFETKTTEPERGAQPDTTTDFEMVANVNDGPGNTGNSEEVIEDNQDGGDYELDELEAEIARELED